MPTYEFTCPKCTTRFDLNRPMSKAGAPAKCPECRATATRVWGAAIVGVGSDFDFDEDIYGALLTVTVHRKIRDEVKFESLDALTEQIGRDILATRRWFADA